MSQLPSHLPPELPPPDLPPPSTCPISLDHGLQVHLQTVLDHSLQVCLQTGSIPVSNCISKLGRLRPQSSHDHGLEVHITKLTRSQPVIVSPNLLEYCLQVRTIMATKCISPNSLNDGLQLYLQTGSITASKFARSWPPSAYLQSHSITASSCISKLAQLWPRSSHNHGLQVHISKLALSRPPGASPNTLDYCLQVPPQSCCITASECISQFTRSRYGEMVELECR